jgi:hypothetical protein
MMGHRSITRRTPPKKEIIPRILSFLEKKLSVLLGPVMIEMKRRSSNKSHDAAERVQNLYRYNFVTYQ